MPSNNAVDSTCWTVIRAAADGDVEARESFAQTYAPVVRAYLFARWRGNALLAQSDDAVQEVFLALLKPAGALERADSDYASGFRPYLFGIIRNVARRFESRVTNSVDGMDMDQLSTDDPSLSQVFDRAWAKTIMQAAATKQAQTANEIGPDAIRRVELLRLRFHHGLPIREIARQWDEPAEALHHEYAKARVEFRNALKQVVAFHQPPNSDSVEQTVSELLAALG